MKIVSKRTSRREYIIQKKLHSLVPKFVPKPLSYRNGIMKTKKFGTSLKKWLGTHRYNNKILSEIIKNVRLILAKIRRRYPGFRHMDLHIGNVLFYRGRIMIIDFGLSKMNAPEVSPCRDINVFIRSLRRHVMKKKGTQEESAASIAKRIALLRA
jgi:tRNA A-37 threonylcarbamoyl transferase component Bud32